MANEIVQTWNGNVIARKTNQVKIITVILYVPKRVCVEECKSFTQSPCCNCFMTICRTRRSLGSLWKTKMLKKCFFLCVEVHAIMISPSKKKGSDYDFMISYGVWISYLCNQSRWNSITYIIPCYVEYLNKFRHVTSYLLLKLNSNTNRTEIVVEILLLLQYQYKYVSQ